MNKTLTRIVALILCVGLSINPSYGSSSEHQIPPNQGQVAVEPLFIQQALAPAILSDSHVFQNFLSKSKGALLGLGARFRSVASAGLSDEHDQEIQIGERLASTWLDTIGIFISPIPKPWQLAARRCVQGVLIALAIWNLGQTCFSLISLDLARQASPWRLAGTSWLIPYVAHWFVPASNFSVPHGLKELVSLNRRIERFQRHPPPGEMLSQAQARRSEFLPLIKDNLTEFSGDLRTELPGQMELWKTIADALGPQVYSEEKGLPKRILRRVERTQSWPTLLENRAVTEAIFRERIAFDHPSWEQHWWARAIPRSLRRSGGDSIAYFSAEFGFWQLGTYGGGLGILAGDFLRIAGKLGMNFSGVSLWYPRGYFRQGLRDGWQFDDTEKPNINPEDLPMERAKIRDTATGLDRDLIIDIPLPGQQEPIKAKVWRAHYGKAELLMVDVDIPENDYRMVGNIPARLMCQRLYDFRGGSWERMLQYYILGVGGTEALRLMGKSPRILHTNDCHPLFAPVMAIVQAMSDATRDKQDPDLWGAFEEALDQIRAKTIFTTHTPVEAGNEKADNLDQLKTLMRTLFEDRFKNKDLADYAANRLTGIGMLDGQFNLAAFLMRFARRRNAVSKLHGAVSRKLWERLFPGFPEYDTPISGIVNGVESEYWMGAQWRTLFTPIFQSLGELMAKPNELRSRLSDTHWIKRHIPIDNRKLASAREEAKRELFAMIRERNPQSDEMDPKALTFGFARRAATYKRAHLLFTDRERLREQILKSKGPVQFVFAGKAHLLDNHGRDLIKGVNDNIHALKAELGDKVRIVYVKDYDVPLAKQLVRAVDVWLTTPERPEEASGTSGMKVGMNGGMNLSVLDGWFDEGYVPGVNGWPISPPLEQPWNDLEAASLYNTLGKVIDTYDNDEETWWRMVKGTVVWTVSQFGMGRMMAEYATTLYGPMLREDRPENTSSRLRKKETLQSKWESLKQSSVTLEPFPFLSTVGRPVNVSILFKPPEGITIDDVGFDLTIGQPNRAWLYSGMNHNLEDLGDGTYRLTAQVTLSSPGTYQLAIRMAPIDQVSWAYDDDDHKPSMSYYFPEMYSLEVIDLNLMAARAMLPGQGVMYYLKIPPPMQEVVQRVRVARAPEWAAAAVELPRLRDGIFGRLVKEWKGDVEFHYILDLEGWGRKPWPLNLEQLQVLETRESGGNWNHFASGQSIGAKAAVDWMLNGDLAKIRLQYIQQQNTSDLVSRLKAYLRNPVPVRERLLRAELEGLTLEEAELQFGIDGLASLQQKLSEKGLKGLRLPDVNTGTMTENETPPASTGATVPRHQPHDRSVSPTETSA